MNELEKLKAAYDSANEAAEVALTAAYEADAAYDAEGAQAYSGAQATAAYAYATLTDDAADEAYAAYQAELKKTKELR